jgi:hypothetical protein
MNEVLYLSRQVEATIYKQDLQLFCTIQAGIPKKHAQAYITKLSEMRNVQLKHIN